MGQGLHDSLVFGATIDTAYMQVGKVYELYDEVSRFMCSHRLAMACAYEATPDYVGILIGVAKGVKRGDLVNPLPTRYAIPIRDLAEHLLKSCDQSTIDRARKVWSLLQKYIKRKKNFDLPDPVLLFVNDLD